MCAVTGMTQDLARAHVDAAGAVWTERSARTWTLDLSILTDVGVAVQRPEPAAGRLAATERGLRQVAAARLTPQPADESDR